MLIGFLIGFLAGGLVIYSGAKDDILKANDLEKLKIKYNVDGKS